MTLNFYMYSIKAILSQLSYTINVLYSPAGFFSRSEKFSFSSSVAYSERLTGDLLIKFSVEQ